MHSAAPSGRHCARWQGAVEKKRQVGAEKTWPGRKLMRGDMAGRTRACWRKSGPEGRVFGNSKEAGVARAE